VQRYFCMKVFQVFIWFCAFTITTQAQVDHSIWNGLLSKHVSAEGWVSYHGLKKDSVQLNQYLKLLSSNPPQEDWTANQKLAFWINAYNAFTVKLIVDNYPVSSIKDIKKGIPFVNSVWDNKFFEIGGAKMNLNEIEHSILRKQFDEPRIHFAIVCASKSCPKLRNEAFTAEKLEQQLQEQAIDFINDTSKNHFEEEEINISQIFNWFEKDFTKKMTLKEFLKAYSKHDFGLYAKVKYQAYDWSLNGE
jgi:hypothetical protein